MKVYIINANWAGGGPGGIAKDLYFSLLEHGHSARFAFCRGSIPPQINSFKYGSKLSVLTHAFLCRIFDVAGFCSRQNVVKLKKDIIKYKPDIISIHNPLGYTLNIPLLLKFINKAGIPTFYTLHDCWILTGHCIFPSTCSKYKDSCGKCPQKNEFPASFVFDRSKKNLMKKKSSFDNVSNLSFISCSQWICDLANSTYLNKYQNTVINNGIDISIFRPTASTFKKDFCLKDKKIILGVASVWTKRKGEHFFVELSKLIPNDWVIVLVGRNLNNETKMCQNILCLEATNNAKELACIYSAADVFVNPTMGDNYPTVNLEALSCGTPVVTFDTGGSGEMITKYGEIVEPGNLPKLFEAIKRVINKNFNRDDISSYSLKFDKKTMFEKYIGLFESSFSNDKQ